MPAPARAETAAELRATGEQLAKDGRLTEAIAAFKRADQAEPRASHACLIALAYIRRELWPQAEIFLTMCHERATPDDPLPDWVSLAEQQLRDRLATAQVAAVTISINPAAVAPRATVTVSSFAPDERFGPRTIHLPIGKHLITASTGDETRQEAIEITDTSPREVVIDFTPPIETPPPPIVRPARSRTVPWAVTAAGGVLALAGGAYHLFAFKPTRDKLAAAADPANPRPDIYDRYSDQFDNRRLATIALYGAGAAAVITGLVLRYTVYADHDDHDERELRVSAELAGGGAIVGVEWRR